MSTRSTLHSSRATLVITIVMVVIALRLARTILIPIALAILLTFMLAPVVTRLQRRLGKVVAVGSVTIMALACIVGIGTLVVGQMSFLVDNLPEYQENIRQKIRSVRSSLGDPISRTQNAVDDILVEVFPKPPEQVGAPASTPQAPVQPSETSTVVNTLQAIVGPVLGPLGSAAMVTVLVIFMLLYYEELRDRFLRLVGTARLNETTIALDEAAKRVSSYLLSQSILNALHGTIIGIGFYFIGLPAPLFWGLLSALLRYIPYLGPMLSTSLAILLSLAVFDGWANTFVLIGFFIVLEIVTNNVVEPLVYGNSTGLLPIAVIVAAIFWTWLWGTAGLVLSAPLTVCLVVLGKHVGQLEFLSIILSSQPILDPKMRFYQRLLALDRLEADAVVARQLKETSLEQVYDDVVLPAMVLAEQDRHRDQLDESREEFIIQTVGEIIEKHAETVDDEATMIAESAGTAALGVSVLCLPARDKADELAGAMLAQLLRQNGVSAQSVSVELLVSEMLELVQTSGARVVCVSAVPPSAIAHARYLYRRLRARFENLQIVLGLWTLSGDPHAIGARVKSDESIKVVTSMAKGREAIVPLVQSMAVTV